MVGRDRGLAVLARLKPASRSDQQPSGKTIPSATCERLRDDITPKWAVMRSGLLEGGVSTLNRRTVRDSGEGSTKVTWPRCFVYVGDRSSFAIGAGWVVNSDGAATTLKFFTRSLVVYSQNSTYTSALPSSVSDSLLSRCPQGLVGSGMWGQTFSSA